MRSHAPWALALLLALAPAAARAHDKHESKGRDITVTGEIVDLACYIAHGGAGAEHAGCAARCAQMGQPIGLKAADGKLYLLVADHADTAPFTKAKNLAGKNAEVKGVVDTKEGINALTVLAVKAA